MFLEGPEVYAILECIYFVPIYFILMHFRRDLPATGILPINLKANIVKVSRESSYPYKDLQTLATNISNLNLSFLPCALC